MKVMLFSDRSDTVKVMLFRDHSDTVKVIVDVRADAGLERQL